jgi:predicted deacylase
MIIVFVLSMNLALAAVDRNKAFTIGTITASPGSTVSGYLLVPAGKDPGTKIPVTVINGTRKGKILALVAGVHAYEYPPILALYRLKEKMDPQRLTGTLILVHIANLPAFQRRIIYYNPYDWKNLNRVFPGNPRGSQAQCIAHVITTKVVKRCDFLIDMHCGDGNEALIPYCYWMLSGNKQMDEKTRKMVLAFGIKYIIIDKSRSKDRTQSKYLGNTAILHGKPAITTESGYLGKTDEVSIARNIKGITSVMRLLGMIEGSPSFVPEPIWIDEYKVIYSQSDGLFYPRTHMGYYVSKGEKVGVITDFFGNVVEELRSPFTGIMLYIIGTPPISKGEPLFEVGRINQ